MTVANNEDVSSGQGSLSSIFLASLPGEVAAALSSWPELEKTLDSLWLEARRAWPDVGMLVHDFLRHLASQLSKHADARESLPQVHAADLLLACAAARGHPRALEAVRQRVFAQLQGTERLLRCAPSFAEDVRQCVCEALFVGSSGGSALATYSGRGSLDSFVRAIALRTASSLRRKSAKEVPLTEGVEAGDAEPLRHLVDVELDFIAAHYRSDFVEAFEQALSDLSPRDRNVLRLAIADGLNIDEIGVIYNVHRTTVARWLAHTRRQLMTRTRAALKERLDASTGDVESILGLLQSRLDLSVGRLLTKLEQ